MKPAIDSLTEYFDNEIATAESNMETSGMIAWLKEMKAKALEAIRARDAEWSTAFAMAVGPASGLKAPLAPEAVAECLDLLGKSKAIDGRVVKALCQNCGPRHVLDNGRLWGLCGLNALSKTFDESELIAAALIANGGKS